MANTQKTGFRYFPLYHSLFTGDKIRDAEDAIDPTGDDIGARMLVDKMLVRIYSAIFKVGYFLKWDNAAKHKLCGEIGNGLTIIKLDRYVSAFFVSGFLNKDLFDKYLILTNKGIQEEWLNISIVYFRRKGAYILPEYNLISSEDSAIDSEGKVRSLGRNDKKLRKAATKAPKSSNKSSEKQQHSEEMVINSEEMVITPERLGINVEEPFIIINTNNKGLSDNSIVTNSNKEDEEGLSEVIVINSEETVINSEEIKNSAHKGTENTGKTPGKHKISEKKNISSESIPENSENSKESINPPVNGFMDIDHLIEAYFSSNALSRTREQVSMTNHMDISMLRCWAEAFNRYLISTGVTVKQRSDWNSHFKNWLNLQNKNLNPINLFTEKHIQNGPVKSTTATNGPANIKGHQPFSWASALSKIDKLVGEDGDPGVPPRG